MTDIDRDLLIQAAKAAGMEVLPEGKPWPRDSHGCWFFNEHGGTGGGMFRVGANVCWNPLTDDGDALRLAVKLNIDTMGDGVLPGGAPCMSVVYPIAGDYEALSEPVRGGDEYAAMRRAIVRAAASMAKKEEASDG